jgi:DnaJ-class molecular chaperone
MLLLSLLITILHQKKNMRKIICTACDGTGSVATHTKVIVCPQCEGVGLEIQAKPKFKSKLQKPKKDE